jgi:hypothetical protein
MQLPIQNAQQLKTANWWATKRTVAGSKRIFALITKNDPIAVAWTWIKTEESSVNQVWRSTVQESEEAPASVIGA